VTTSTSSATRNEQHEQPPDIKSAFTRALIIELAVVEDRLRSLASRAPELNPPPNITAARDQLQTHERHILRALHRRQLGFRALPSDGHQRGNGSRLPREIW
jgi:hypothetical protein